MPAKILGVLLIVAGMLMQRGVRVARVRGYVGPRYRRVYRQDQKWKFRIALGSQGLGAFICFTSAFFCLTGGLHHGS
jgi:hypothetical protein